MARIIAFVNQKGGVAKTTSVINVGAGLALAGKKVLLVDLDAQGHLTFSLGVNPIKNEHTINEVLKGEIKPVQAILSIDDKYHIIPSDIRLSSLEIKMQGRVSKELLLRRALKKIEAYYDYILLDCPPALNLLTLNGLAAADEFIIPTQAEYLALHGLTQLLEVVEVIRSDFNTKLTLNGLLLTMYDRRKSLYQSIHDNLKNKFKDKLFETVIRDNVALAEAQAFNTDIFDYKPSSNGAKDYNALVGEILNQEDKTT